MKDRDGKEVDADSMYPADYSQKDKRDKAKDRKRKV